MSSKKQILARIREALQVKAPIPGHGHNTRTPGAGPSEGLKGITVQKGLQIVREDGVAVTQPASSDFSQWLPPVGEDHASQMALFQANAADLRAEVHLCGDSKGLAAKLRELAAEEGWKKVGTHSGALTDPAVAALGLPAVRTNEGYDVQELEQCDVGITECDALVAQTGSVLVTSLSAGGRALSVLPPHHVVLARREQLVADLSAAYGVLHCKHGDAYPTLISFITGPSRTGDIERILVLGAHGPKRLTILCCD